MTADSPPEITPVPAAPLATLDTLTPADVVRQVALIQQVMAEVMKDGEHYGKIPGCGDKPTLLQPGAQILGLTFRLTPRFRTTERDLGNGHREYRTDVDIVHIPTGQIVAMGVGTCSTMESKYRWRKMFNESEVGDVPKTYWDIPQENKQARHAELVEAFGPGRYRRKRTDDGWKVFRIEGDDQRVENPDIADTYNTVLKISAKRGFVHGILNATAASEMFTQDLEDLAGEAAADSAGEVQTPGRVTDNTLGVLRALRLALDTPDAKYAEQIRTATSGRTSNDHELTEDEAALLIRAYETRQQAPAHNPSDYEGLGEREDIRF